MRLFWAIALLGCWCFTEAATVEPVETVARCIRTIDSLEAPDTNGLPEESTLDRLMSETQRDEYYKTFEEKPAYQVQKFTRLPFISRCCPRSNYYDCTSISVPVYNWFWENRTWKCYIISPVPRRAHCTCDQCIKKSWCGNKTPVGRCYPSSYTSSKVFAICYTAVITPPRFKVGWFNVCHATSCDCY